MKTHLIYMCILENQCGQRKPSAGIRPRWVRCRFALTTKLLPKHRRNLYIALKSTQSMTPKGFQKVLFRFNMEKKLRLLNSFQLDPRM